MTSSTDTILLIIITVFLSLFLLSGIVALIAIYKLVRNIRQVVERADEVIDSVESAAEVFKDSKGNLALLKVLTNIIKLASKRLK